MNGSATQYILSAVVTVIFASPVCAQSCADFLQLPVSKAQLNNIAANLNIDSSEDAFEAFALATIQGSPITPNTEKFPSEAREVATDGEFKNVVPDGVLPLIVVKSLTDIRTFDNSVFYEAKAVTNTSLPPSGGSGRYQILGFIDALRQSTDAGKAREGIPAIVFMTTSDVIPLSFETRYVAFELGVSISHSVVCKPILFSPPGVLQLGPAEVLVPEVYVEALTVPGSVGPGAKANLQDYAN